MGIKNNKRKMLSNHHISLLVKLCKKIPIRFNKKWLRGIEGHSIRRYKLNFSLIREVMELEFMLSIGILMLTGKLWRKVNNNWHLLLLFSNKLLLYFENYLCSEFIVVMPIWNENTLLIFQYFTTKVKSPLCYSYQLFTFCRDRLTLWC